MKDISREGLWNKAKVFLERALQARNVRKYDEFQFWASLALELVAKASLSAVHPAFVVDTKFDDLLVAFGKSTADCKTIPANAVFDRCARLYNAFDAKAKKFCEQIAGRRNADIHSGGTPFAGMPLATWQGEYWKCIKVLAEAQGETLETLVDADEARAASEIIADAAKSLDAAVKGRIEHHGKSFREGRSPDDLKRLIEASRFAVGPLSEETAEQTCPACSCEGIVWGEYVDTVDDDSKQQSMHDQFTGREEWVAMVREIYSVERFLCMGCKLELDGREEIEIAGLPEEFEVEAVKEYDDDYYMND